MNDNDKEKIWAYVDSEMPPSERADFERAIKSDPDLAREVESVRKFDQSLYRLLPISEQKEDKLESQILSAWEKSQEPARPRAVEEREAWSLFPWSWPRIMMPALALAACVLIGVGISARMAGPLQWIEMGGLAVVRGPGESAYPAEELGRMRKTVQIALKAEFQRQPAAAEISIMRGLKSPWYWDVRVAPTADGALLVQVAILGKPGGAVAKEWAQTFSSADELSGGIEKWAAVVVAESRAAPVP